MATNKPNIPGLIRLPQPLMMDPSTSQSVADRPRSKPRSRNRSKPKNKNPGQGQQGQGQDEAGGSGSGIGSSGQSQIQNNILPHFQQPLPQASISSTRGYPHRTVIYQNSTMSKNRPAPIQQRHPYQYDQGGGNGDGLLQNPPVPVPPQGQGQGQKGSGSRSVPLWRIRPQQSRPENSSNSSPNVPVSSTIPPKPRPTFQEPPPFSYARVFSSILDNPGLHARRDQIFQTYQELRIKDQLEEMQRSLSLTPDTKEHRARIVDHILLTLRNEYPLCRIYTFGSFRTGLADATSDVDLYLDAFGETVGHKPKFAKNTQDILDRCYRCLKRAKCPVSYKALCRVVPIREARVPILKITHWSNINLDLSFENITSVRNSEMISLYMELDPCVKPLMVLIRFWAKFHSLIGSNNIKSYCLNLLLLVFLTSKKIVPSVEKLQMLREVERKQELANKDKDQTNDIINGWNTGFANLDTIHRRIWSSERSIAATEFGGDLAKAVLSLAKDFFNMFANIDFNSVVVCTKTAEILPYKLFTPGNEEDLPEALESYKDWAVQQPANRRLNILTPLCVQDPFVLSFNVGAVTPFTTLFKFQVACRQTAEILENGSVTNLLQLLIPLPKEVGDRKFLNMQEKQRETIKLKVDVNYFLEHGKFPSHSDNDETENPSSEESLGLHRLPLREIIDKNSVRFGKGWESLSLLVPSTDFLNLFADTILQHNLYKKGQETTPLFEKLKQLWLLFLDDFLEEFCENCFLLQVNKEEREMDERWFINPPYGERIRKNYELIFTERKKRNNKQNDPVANNIQPEDCARLDNKLANLGNIHYKYTCMRLTCSAFFPVWHKRIKIQNDMMALGKLSTTADTNDGSPGQSASSKSRRRRRTKIKSSTDETNPLEIEKRVSKIIKEQLESTTKPMLTFAVFIKIDNSYVDDLPTVSIACDKVKGTDSHLYNFGVQSFMDTLNEVFEPYSMYRLKNWFKDNGDNDEDASSSCSSSPEMFENTDDFDSLMPPTPSSSASECSSPVPEDKLAALVVTGEWDDEK